MSATRPSRVAVLALVAVTGALLSCEAPTEPDKEPADLVISPSVLSMEIGATQSVAVQARSASGHPLPLPGLMWGSSRPSVASVSMSGVITAVSVGSAEISASTGSLTARVTVNVAALLPGAPTITGVSPGDRSLTVDFSAPNSDGGAPVTSYEYSTDNGTSWTSRSPASSLSPLVITGLVNGTSYAVRLRAVNSAGQGPASPPESGRPQTSPSAPQITGVAAADGALSVEFAAPSSDGGASITNYEYSTDDGVTWTPRSPAATSSPILVAGLTNGTEYEVRLRAVNAVGPGAASPMSAAIPVTVPGAPTISAITPGNAQLTIEFSAPAVTGGGAIESYQYSLDGDAWVSPVPAVVASPLVISGLENGRSFSVRVRAVSGVGPGPASDPEVGTPRTTPSEALITGITSGDAQMNVAFSAPSSDGGAAITNYEVSTDDGGTWHAREPAGTASPILVAGLNNGTSYEVRIRAINAAGPGLASAAAVGVPRTVPGAPDVTSYLVGDAQIALTFTPPPNDGGASITNYQYSTDNGSTWEPREPAGTTSPLVITGLTNGASYQPRIRAVNAAGPGAASQSVPSGGFTPRTVPSAPGISGISAGDAELSVAFTAPTSTGGAQISNYEYSTDDGSTWIARSPASTASPLVLSALENGTAYAVRLRAVNAAGAGAASMSVSATPSSPVVGAPTGVRVETANSSVRVAFSAPSEIPGSPTLNYEYSVDDGATWTARTPAATTSPLVIMGLRNGNVYQVRLRAVNGDGAGTASSTVTAELPLSPFALTADPVEASLVSSVACTTFGDDFRVADWTDLQGYHDAGGAPDAAVPSWAVGWIRYNGEFGLGWGTSYPIAARQPVHPGFAVYDSIATEYALGRWSGPYHLLCFRPSTSSATPPSAPAITGVAPSNGQLSISFSPPASSGGAAIVNYEYSVNNGGTWAPRSPASTSSPLTIAGLTNGVAYAVRIRAVNSAGSGEASSSATGTPSAGESPPSVPGAPTITLISAGNAQLGVAFTAPTSDGGAAITNYQFSTNNGSSWTTRSPASTTSPLIITGLSNGVSYPVRLRAVNSAGAGAASLSMSGTPVASVAPPAAPMNLTATAQSSSRVDLTWTDASSNETSFLIESCIGGSCTAFQQIGSTGAGAVTYQHTGLTAGTTHSYRVRASNGAGYSGYSNIATATTQTAPQAPAAPGQPSVSEPTSSSLRVTWNAVGGATSYRLLAANTSAGPYAEVATGTYTTVVDTPLDGGTTYYYRVRACNAAGCSGDSPTASGLTRPEVPSAPTVSDATTTTQRISWSSVEGATSYRVYRASSSSGVYSELAQPSASPYTSSGLTGGQTYYYRIAACNSSGCSDRSSAAGASTAPATPSAPTFSAVTNTSLSLSWSAVAGANSYRVLRSGSSSGTFSAVGSPAGTSFVDSPLSSNATYYYRLQACSEAGCSGQSATASRTTPPATPAPPTVSVSGATSFDVTWSSVTGATNFILYRSTDPDDGFAVRYSGSATSRSETGLAAGVRYYYRLAACSAHGCSPLSGYGTNLIPNTETAYLRFFVQDGQIWYTTNVSRWTDIGYRVGFSDELPKFPISSTVGCGTLNQFQVDIGTIANEWSIYPNEAGRVGDYGLVVDGSATGVVVSVQGYHAAAAESGEGFTANSDVQSTRLQTSPSTSGCRSRSVTLSESYLATSGATELRLWYKAPTINSDGYIESIEWRFPGWLVPIASNVQSSLIQPRSARFDGRDEAPR